MRRHNRPSASVRNRSGSYIEYAAYRERAQGNSSWRTQGALFIAAGTVNYRMRNIYAILGVRSRKETIDLVREGKWGRGKEAPQGEQIFLHEPPALNRSLGCCLNHKLGAVNEVDVRCRGVIIENRQVNLWKALSQLSQLTTCIDMSAHATEGENTDCSSDADLAEIFQRGCKEILLVQNPLQGRGDHAHAGVLKMSADCAPELFNREDGNVAAQSNRCAVRDEGFLHRVFCKCSQLGTGKFHEFDVVASRSFERHVERVA